MACQPSQTGESTDRIRRCQQGDAAALAELRTELHGQLLAILHSRGANATEAQDILADLWSDCVEQSQDKPSLLEKFSGRTTLPRWLATVATNRWLDLKRRQARFVPAQSDPSGPVEQAAFPAGNSAALAPETTLVGLLGESLRAAFAQCSPQALVLLRLVYLHQLHQREVGRMLGWGESKLSRYLSDAMNQIERETHRELRRRDPWLQLTWQDFVDLCEIHDLGFL